MEAGPPALRMPVDEAPGDAIAHFDLREGELGAAAPGLCASVPLTRRCRRNRCCACTPCPLQAPPAAPGAQAPAFASSLCPRGTWPRARQCPRQRRQSCAARERQGVVATRGAGQPGGAVRRGGRALLPLQSNHEHEGFLGQCALRIWQVMHRQHPSLRQRAHGGSGGGGGKGATGIRRQHRFCHGLPRHRKARHTARGCPQARPGQQ